MLPAFDTWDVTLQMTGSKGAGRTVVSKIQPEKRDASTGPVYLTDEPAGGEYQHRPILPKSEIKRRPIREKHRQS